MLPTFGGVGVLLEQWNLEAEREEYEDKLGGLRLGLQSLSLRLWCSLAAVA